MPSIFKLGALALACVASASAQIIGTTTGTAMSTSAPCTSTLIPHGNTTAYAPTTTSSVHLTTSTVYATMVETISKCPSYVTDCPYGSVVTKTVALYTTVCPVAGSPAVTTSHGPVAPYPTPSFYTIPKPGNSSAPIGTGTGTGVVRPTSPWIAPPVLITTVNSPHGPVATYSPPIIEASGAGKMGVSSVLALIMTGAFALLF